MSHEENIARIKIQIEQVKREIAELKKIHREEIRAEARKNRKKNRKKPGRKSLPTELLERVRKMARVKTLPDTALSLGVGLASLYNYGISRKSIDAEISLENDLQKKDKSS